MASCKFIKRGEISICEVCGFTTDKINPFRAVCKTPPSLLTKIGNFIPALTHHVMTGMKKCTQEEIGRRLNICKDCPLFVANTCSHDSCGCNIKDTQTFFNKLYWADQKCPLDKWGVIAPSG